MLLMLLFFVTPLKGSNKKELQRKIEDIESALMLVENKIEPRNTMRTINEAKNALSIAEEIKYDRGIIKAHYIIALSYFYTSDYKESMRYLVKIEHLKGIKKQIHYIAQMHYLKGRIYYLTGMTDYSRNELDQALRVAFKVKNDNNRNLILANIYSAYARTYESADDDKTIELFDNYLKLSHQAHKRITDDFKYTPLPEFFIMKIEKFVREDNSDSASYYVQRLKDLSLDKRFLGLPQAYSSLGSYYLYKHQLDSASIYLTYAELLTEQSGVVCHLPHLYKGLSNYYKQEGDTKEAAYYAEMSVEEENKQAVARLTAGEEVMRIVLEDSHSHIHNRIYKTLGILAVSLVTVSFVLAKAYSKRRKKKLLCDYKKEAAKLQRQTDCSAAHVLEMAKNNDPAFMAHFQEVYSQFWDKLIKVHSDLSPAELHLCAMTYLNFTSKQIADYSGIQPASVNTRRSRLRKKINLKGDIELYDYLTNL